MLESSFDFAAPKDRNLQNKSNKNAKLWNQINKANITKTATQQEFNDFINKAWSNDKTQYQQMPNAIKVATLDKDLMKALNLENGDTYLTKSQAIHTRQSRKEAYNQDIERSEYDKIPQVIASAKEAYLSGDYRILLPFANKDKSKINVIILENDMQGNLIITTKKLPKEVLNQYQSVSAGGSRTRNSARTLENKNASPSTTLTASADTSPNSTTTPQKSSKDSAKQSASLNSPMNRL